MKKTQTNLLFLKEEVKLDPLASAEEELDTDEEQAELLGERSKIAEA